MPMKFKLEIMRREEQIYAYSQSAQLDGQTGSIGHLRGDFGLSGDLFYSSWFDHIKENKTDEFKTEFDEVVNSLRKKEVNGLLSGRDSMLKVCQSHDEAGFEGNYCREYGFRLRTTNYTHLIRCNPVKGDYNFYIYCYHAGALEAHMEQAKRGIRFLDANSLEERFRISDGEKIRVIDTLGTKHDQVCRFVDETHFESGSRWGGIYHIYEFAEKIQKNGGMVIPLRASLPEQCYGILPSTGEIIILKKGESGFYKTKLSDGSKQEKIRLVHEYNQKMGVNQAQAAAMLAGSMFGWHVPAADPASYDTQGQLMRSKLQCREQDEIR